VKANFGFVVLAAMGMVPVAAFAGEVVYTNDFSAGAGSDWSVTGTSTTPGTLAHPADAFLGEFGLGNNTDTLTLTGLDPYTTGTVTFDLYAIQSLDGNGEFGGGPDDFSVDSGSTTLIATNFANFPGNTQAYPDSIAPIGAGADNAPDTGAVEVNTLGYTFDGSPMDAVFDLSATFASTGSTLSLVFNFDSNEDLATNEGFGIDNISVSTDGTPSTPEPATLALLGGGLGLFSLIRKYKKQA
jgi:hypothetical protein